MFLGTVTSAENSLSQENILHGLDIHPDKTYATVKISEPHDIKLNVDTEADACVITTRDLQHFQIAINILPCNNILRGYAGSKIENIGAVMLKVSSKDKSIDIKFNIVEDHFYWDVNSPGLPRQFPIYDFKPR